MDGATAEAVLRALEGCGIGTLDITGGAPELNPHFHRLVAGARGLGRKVIARSNLTIFFEDGMEGLPQFLAENQVEIIASLPYYSGASVDRVRGPGAFEKSVEALRTLNGLGYGRGGPRLGLVYNPPGAFLPPLQCGLEAEFKKRLMEDFGVAFDRLYAFVNMPIGRFRDFLSRTGNLEGYMARLEGAFNPATLGGLMCRKLVSVGWDGRLFDCDFNQVLGLGIEEGPSHIADFDYGALSGRKIRVGDHCFGCTAGQGST